jgi:hypothetical protein
MLKFTMFLGLMALVFSCGKKQEEIGPQGVGGRFELSETKKFEQDEKQTLASLCEGLEIKENYYRSNFADKGAVFNFESQKKGCDDNRAMSYATGAKVKFVNGKMEYVKMAQAAYIFNDIVLRNTGELQDFCDAQADKSLDARYIQNGKIARIIYLQKRNTQISVAIETAYDFDSDGEYVVETKDQYVIVDTKNEWQGVVKIRSQETKAGCFNGAVSVLSTRLESIKN